MPVSQSLRIAFGLSNILIGLCYGFLIFSLIPMWYGLLGALFAIPVLLTYPRVQPWILLLIYWVTFTVLLFGLPKEGMRELLFEPFRNLR
jgi:hypothetical protein